MAGKRANEEIINVNVGGKKFTLRRSVLTADPKSRLTEWFKPNATKAVAQDKSGNFYLDRDGQTFRHIVTYLRFKKDKFATSLALPCKPDDVARVLGEAEALNLEELRDMCAEMLARYQKEETGYQVAYINAVVRDYEGWSYEKGGSENRKSSGDLLDNEGW